MLTKALGSGVISTALKRDKVQESWVDAATQTMASLNRPAADVLRQLDGVGEEEPPVRAATDVTGFGLVGHAKEMASGRGVHYGSIINKSNTSPVQSKPHVVSSSRRA